MSETWSMKGTVLISCNCDYGCPCNFNARPSHGHCEGGWLWHVEDGMFGDVRLDGVTWCVYADWPGAIHEGGGEGVFLVDERADDAQREALQKVFSGQAGGWMGIFAELVGEVRGLEFVPIEFKVAKDLAYWRAEIPGRLKAFAEALSGPTTPAGARVQLHNAPGSEVGPRQIMTWGKTVDNEVDGFGLQWSWAGQSSKHIPFDWTGPQYG